MKDEQDGTVREKNCNIWYTLNSNSGVRLAVSWQGKPLISWELQNTAPDWKDMQKQSDNSMENSGW